MKQVRETAAAKSISAWVILKEGKEIATVQAYYSNAGVVQADVWDALTGTLSHQRRAGGYGYDKLTAAMSGAWIGGIQIYDHSVHCEAAMKEYLAEGHERAVEELFGVQFANWSRETGKYESCFYHSGLDRLKSFGFQVIQAI